MYVRWSVISRNISLQIFIWHFDRFGGFFGCCCCCHVCCVLVLRTMEFVRQQCRIIVGELETLFPSLSFNIFQIGRNGRRINKNISRRFISYYIIVLFNCFNRIIINHLEVVCMYPSSLSVCVSHSISSWHRMVCVCVWVGAKTEHDFDWWSRLLVLFTIDTTTKHPNSDKRYTKTQQR